MFAASLLLMLTGAPEQSPNPFVPSGRSDRPNPFEPAAGRRDLQNDGQSEAIGGKREQGHGRAQTKVARPIGKAEGHRPADDDCNEGPETKARDDLCPGWAIVKATRDAGQWSRDQVLVAAIGFPVLVASVLLAFRSFRQARIEFASSNQADCEVVGVVLSAGWRSAVAKGNHAFAFVEIANAGRRTATQLKMVGASMTLGTKTNSTVVRLDPILLQPLRGGAERTDRLAFSLRGAGTTLDSVRTSSRMEGIFDVRIEGRLGYRSGQDDLEGRSFKFCSDDLNRSNLRMVEQD
jgi:hypothetical protein